jgi:hypothetical protein
VANYLTPDSNLVITASVDDQLASSGYTALLTDSNDAPLVEISGAADGSHVDKFFDPADQQAWSVHTVGYNAQDHTIGDVFNYDTADVWSASPFLPSDIKRFNEAAAQVFVADLARIAFHGTAADEAVPTALSYEPIFGSGYDFGIGSFDIDIGAAATVGFVDYGLGWDASAYQYWDGWTGQSNTFPTYTFDDWSYGTWIEPVVLDLDGNGVNITSRIAWAGAGDGLPANSYTIPLGPKAAEALKTFRAHCPPADRNN